MKKALGMLVEQLRDEDHVAIVTYANQTQVRLPATSGREKAKIRQVVESLECGGGTSGGDGLRLAYEEIRRNFSPEAAFAFGFREKEPATRSARSSMRIAMR